ncbi:MAG: hypothetical protein ACOYOL_04975 [Chthoniobacterales bacterium]
MKPKALLLLPLLLIGLLSAVRAQPTAITTYEPGALFLGFRQVGTNATANSLAVKIGQASQFLPPSLGGTATPGSPFNVQFGVVPGSGTPVFNLTNDLTAVFGSTWTNNPTNGSGVRWAVVGFTDDSLNNTPIANLTARSAFVTRARTNPATQSTPLVYSATSHLDPFAAEFKNFAYGTGGGAYAAQQSTTNSSVALIDGAGLLNNWSTRIGTAANGSFGLGSARRVEQPQLGNFTGPTASVLDLYLAPYTGSTLVTNTTFLGTFIVTTNGQLTFTPTGGALTPYQTWTASYGLSGTNAVTTADPDLDGFANRQEFAFGTSPIVGNAALVGAAGAGTNVLVTFLARATNEVTYNVRSGTNLSAWSPDAVSITNGPVSPTPPTNYTRRQFSVPASGAKFFRVDSVILNP